MSLTSPFATIFLATKQRILTEVPAIAFIDQELGQLRNGNRPPVSWPCILIDFEDFVFKDLGENVQTASGTVVLRLGFAPHSNSSSVTPAPYLEKAFAYYDLEWILHKAIHGWSPGTDMGAFARIAAATQKRNDNYRVREIRYSIAFEDYSAKWQQLYAPATIQVEQQML